MTFNSNPDAVIFNSDEIEIIQLFCRCPIFTEKQNSRLDLIDNQLTSNNRFSVYHPLNIALNNSHFTYLPLGRSTFSYQRKVSINGDTGEIFFFFNNFESGLSYQRKVSFQC